MSTDKSKNDELLERLRKLARRGDEDSNPELEKTRTEARIDQIVAMMCSGAWVTGVSHRLLCEVFNVGLTTVEAYSAEASRVIRRMVRESPEDRADMLARLKQTFERLGQKAESRGSEKGYRDAIEAYKMLALLHGVVKQQVVVEDADPFQGWSRAEKEHFVETGEKPVRGVAGDAGSS
jgi:hypothetical protein